jgi:hypothetical protein
MPQRGARVRTVDEVIDQAIRENRVNEYILYGFAILFVGLGTGAFIYSLVSGHWALSMGSALESGLLYPAMSAVQRIRRENQNIRLLEIPLSHSATADEAAAAGTKPLDRNLAKIKGGEMLGPKHTASEVAEILEEGLRTGTIVLDQEAADIQRQNESKQVSDWVREDPTDTLLPTAVDQDYYYHAHAEPPRPRFRFGIPVLVCAVLMSLSIGLR